MEDFELSYREVIPDQTTAEARKENVVNTGMCALCVLRLSFPFDAKYVLMLFSMFFS